MSSRNFVRSIHHLNMSRRKNKADKRHYGLKPCEREDEEHRPTYLAAHVFCISLPGNGRGNERRTEETFESFEDQSDSLPLKSKRESFGNRAALSYTELLQTLKKIRWATRYLDISMLTPCKPITGVQMLHVFCLLVSLNTMNYPNAFARLFNDLAEDLPFGDVQITS